MLSSCETKFFTFTIYWQLTDALWAVPSEVVRQLRRGVSVVVLLDQSRAPVSRAFLSLA